MREQLAAPNGQILAGIKLSNGALLKIGQEVFTESDLENFISSNPSDFLIVKGGHVILDALGNEWLFERGGWVSSG